MNYNNDEFGLCPELWFSGTGIHPRNEKLMLSSFPICISKCFPIQFPESDFWVPDPSYLLPESPELPNLPDFSESISINSELKVDKSWFCNCETGKSWFCLNEKS